MNFNSQSTFAGFFSNFTSPSKLKIITSLAASPLTVSQIVSRTGVEQSNVSHHLSVLSECGIVSYRQVGKSRVYAVNKETVFPLLHIAQKHTGSCPSSCKRECTLQ